MLTLRPWKAVRQYKLLVEGLRTIHEQRAKMVDGQEQCIKHLENIVKNQQGLIVLKDAEIARLKADVKLLEAATVEAVDPILRDGVLDPPEPKKYLN
jgi:hypothetical protein